MPDDAEIIEMVGLAGGPRLQKIALIVPTYIYLSSYTYANHLEVIEADMILPRDALLKHALHTDDIVGSVYVQHAPPFHINAQWRDPEGTRRWGHPTAESWREMLGKEALWECDVVGLGCTSIARKVIEDWPADQLMFWNDYSRDDAGDPTTLGEVSHDVWFCTHARDLGYKVYIDTSIRCAQRTEGEVTVQNYIREHADAFQPRKPAKILVPRGPGSEVGFRA